MTLQKKISLLITCIASLLMVACNPKPEKINYGKDSCAECKMTIMDSKFGAEVVTKKGKIYKFDDTHCIALFLERRGVDLSNIHKTLFARYDEPGEFVDVKNAEFVVSAQFKSPMGGNAAAFKTVKDAERKSAEIPGSRVTNWPTLYNVLIK
jgi:copper chaperone NosL